MPNQIDEKIEEIVASSFKKMIYLYLQNKSLVPQHKKTVKALKSLIETECNRRVGEAYLKGYKNGLNSKKGFVYTEPDDAESKE